MRKPFLILLLFFVFSASQLKAQNNILDLEPELIAAASCNGMIAGNTLINYENGVLSEAVSYTHLTLPTKA